MSAIHVEVAQGVATITLDGPSTRNALNPQSSLALVSACEEIDANPDVGAVVIRGANDTFCSGAERGVLDRAGEDPAESGRYGEVSAIYRAFARVGELQAPTIAAVRGAAVDAGVNLLLATDLRIVATDVRIIAGFMRIGIHPGGGHFTLLTRLVGREAATAIGLFGEEVDGPRAVELGLAWESVDAAEVDDRAARLAARVARDPELARRAVASLRTEAGPPGLTWAAALDLERGPQMWSLRRRTKRPPAS